MIPTKANPMPADLYQFIWGIRRETPAVQQWLDNPSTTVNISVAADSAINEVILCTVGTKGASFLVDLNGHKPAASSLQACIDLTPAKGILELPLGIYLMDSQVVINHPMTLRTAGIPTTSTDGCWSPYPSVTPCAVMQASPNLLAKFGMLNVSGPDDVILEHLIFDGNRDARIDDPPILGSAFDVCKKHINPDDFSYCINGMSFSRRGKLLYSAALNAIGTWGFVAFGDGLEIRGNVFRDNGIHDDVQGTNQFAFWADGLTVGISDGARIISNYFADNTDVDLVTDGGGFGAPGTVQGNTFLHTKPGHESFAALMLLNTGAPASASPMSLIPGSSCGTIACYPTCGNFTGWTVSDNTIDCGAQGCDHGIMLGQQPWFGGNNACPNIYGGTVTANRVTGAKQGINADGAGTTAIPLYLPIGAPVAVYGNDVSGFPTTPVFGCGLSYAITDGLNISDRGSSPAGGAHPHNWITDQSGATPLPHSSIALCP